MAKRDTNILDTVKGALTMGGAQWHFNRLCRLATLHLSIDMSTQSIVYPMWVRTLEDGARGNPLLAKNLIREIIEQSVMATPEVAQFFTGYMQKLGVCFALDILERNGCHFSRCATSFQHAQMEKQFTKTFGNPQTVKR